jgi:hypothetical protein
MIGVSGLELQINAPLKGEGHIQFASASAKVCHGYGLS